MKSIKLLDCTLRDGGYINDWNFGKEAIKNIGNNIILSGIEFFEIGFLKDQEYDENIAIFDGNQNIKKNDTAKKEKYRLCCND
jgi:4-hydroxy 2-oxovalerate aldolase